MKSSARTFGFWILTLLIAVGLFGLAACKSKSSQDQAAEKAVEKMLEKASGGKADFDIQEGKVKIKTEEGESEISTGEQEWPKDLPEGVPQFTMGKIRGVTRSDAQGNKSWNVILEEVEAGAVEKYTEALKSKEWEITQTMTMGEGGMTQAMKDNVVLIAMFDAKGKSANISVSTQTEE
jgi:hypothetical protein